MNKDELCHRVGFMPPDLKEYYDACYEEAKNEIGKMVLQVGIEPTTY